MAFQNLGRLQLSLTVKTNDGDRVVAIVRLAKILSEDAEHNVHVSVARLFSLRPT